MEKYLREEGYSEGYIENIVYGLRKHTFPEWEGRYVEDIEPGDIKFLIRTKMKTESEYKKRSVLKYVRKAMNVAVELGVLKISPVPLLHLGRKTVSYPEVLSETEVRQFLNKAKEMESEWYSHWLLATYLGLRNGELYALRWRNVDFISRQIKIDSAWTSKSGFKKTKTNTDRIVEIAPALLTHLQELKLLRGTEEYVLPRIDAWDKGEQARELRLFLSGVGIKPVKFHALRATWATIMLKRGIPPVQVMSMGGWRSIKTLKHYVDLAGVSIKGITDGLSLHDTATVDAKILEYGSQE